MESVEGNGRRATDLERAIFTAQLTATEVLSALSQTYHLEFTVPGLERFDFVPGQFISVVVDRVRTDGPRAGEVRQETRAYSLASAPGHSKGANRFDLCLNRVRSRTGSGFFSNLLCDLQVGDTIQFHGPHGDFTLRQPLADSILIAADTGIAPIRGMMVGLFPKEGVDLSLGHQLALVHSASREAELHYRGLFQQLSGGYRNIQYHSVIEEDAAQPGLLAQITRVLRAQPSIQTAYVCGLNAMVAPVRAHLKQLGWDRKQIVFERYD